MNDYQLCSSNAGYGARRMAGITLIELMIVVVIISILVSIAVPSYSQFVREGQRSLARTQLMDIANRQQEHFFNNKVYASSLTALGYSAATMNISKSGNMGAADADAVYSLSVSAGSATAFTLVAAPKNGQTADSECGSFSLNSDGTKSATGSLGVGCWN